jgi:hypothetical protein
MNPDAFIASILAYLAVLEASGQKPVIVPLEFNGQFPPPYVDPGVGAKPVTAPPPLVEFVGVPMQHDYGAMGA